jgi:hypothetical protein
VTYFVPVLLLLSSLFHQNFEISTVTTMGFFIKMLQLRGRIIQALHLPPCLSIDILTASADPSLQR